MPFDETTGYRGNPPRRGIDNIEMMLKQNRARLRRVQNNRHTTVRVLGKSRLAANSPVGVEGELATDGEDKMWVYLNGAWTQTRCFGVEAVPLGAFVLVISDHFVEGDETPEHHDGMRLWLWDLDLLTVQMVTPMGSHDFHPIWNWDQSKVVCCSYPSYIAGYGYTSDPWVYSARRTHDMSLILMNPDGSDRTVLELSEGPNAKVFSRFRFSPDNSLLSYVDVWTDELFVIPVSGGSPTLVCDYVLQGGPAAGFSADGQWIYYERNSSNPNGTGLERCRVDNPSIKEDVIGNEFYSNNIYASISPDNTKVAIQNYNVSGENIRIFELGDVEPSVIIEGVESGPFGWSPDSTKLTGVNWGGITPQMKAYIADINTSSFIETQEFPDPADEFGEIQYSSSFTGDGSKIVFKYENPPFYWGLASADVETGAITVIEAADDSGIVTDYPFNTDQVAASPYFTVYEDGTENQP